MFLNQIIDWQGFEQFVTDLYKDDGDVTVEHDVTLKGKSGANRQIDVLITRKSKLHSYQTMVECKYWNKKVERNIVDIVFAGLEDLNIEKGVIFTTTGYEKGAIEYAKSKNIDIFVVRDLTPEEWGLPGQIIQFYLHLATAQIDNLKFINTVCVPVVEEYPKSLNLNIELSKDMKLPKEYQLYSIKNGNKGDNLIQFILSARDKLISEMTKDIFVLNNGNDCIQEIKATAILDFSKFEFRQLRNQYGAINLSQITFEITTQLSQLAIKIDKAKSYNIALAIQNYIDNQIHLVYQKQGQEGVTLTDNIYNKIAKTATTNKDILQNGSIFKVICQYWVTPNHANKDILCEKKLEKPFKMEIKTI